MATISFGVSIDGGAGDTCDSPLPPSGPGVTAFQQELLALGWSDERKLQIMVRFAGGNVDRLREYAAELISMNPDVIFTQGTPPIVILQQYTKSIPIVFAQVFDPVASRLVASLTSPGGNTTGFATFAYELGQKWLEVLKEVAHRWPSECVPSFERSRSSSWHSPQ